MTTTSRFIGLVAALALTPLAACNGGSDDGAAPNRSGEPGNNPITLQAAAYVGAAFDEQWREMFQGLTHVHDSWNPCHLGEDVPKSMQGKGPECYSRLRSHTGR